MSAVMEEKTFRGLREIAVLGLFAAALFFLIALVTFSNEDAGWTHSGTVKTVTNACGVLGAWIADFTLSFFGLIAYLFPVILSWHGYMLYGQAKQKQQKMTIALQWLGSLGTIVSGAALFYLYVLRVGVELPGGTGGILGQETGDAVLHLFGNSGATLFLIVLLLSGVTLATELSWVTFIDLIGKYTVFVCRIVCHTAVNLRHEPMDNSAQSFNSIADKSDSRRKPIIKALASVGNKGMSSENNTQPLQKQLSPKYKAGEDILPSLGLLDERDTRVVGYSQTDLEDMSRLVEDILADFNVAVAVVGFHPGPVITRFELQPAAGVKVSRISSLSKDLARALSVTSVRIVEIIPGKSVVGLEIPNREREMVTLRELLASHGFEKAKSMLTLAMGQRYCRSAFNG